MVQVELGTEMEEQLTRRAREEGVSLSDLVRRELEINSRFISMPTEAEIAQRKQSIEALLRFRSEQNLTLGPGLTIRELIDEGRR